MKLMLGTLLLCLTTLVWAQTDPNMTASQNEKNSAGADELQRATEAVEHMSSTAPDKGVPREVLEGAKCVAVIPKLVKGAFIVGGEHGTGVATCRSNGKWSPPAPFSVSGVSWGPQIGGKSTDLLMFFMNDQGMNNLMEGHIKLGADVSAAAGPVGRQASAEGGWKAGILTYSNSKGAFIGASLNGAELHADSRLIRDWYGKDVPFKDVLQGQVQIPNAQARAFVNAVQSAKETAQSR
jgi:lipid-binding SYLF domain-containing protein